MWVYKLNLSQPMYSISVKLFIAVLIYISPVLHNSRVLHLSCAPSIVIYLHLLDLSVEGKSNYMFTVLFNFLSNRPNTLGFNDGSECFV